MLPNIVARRVIVASHKPPPIVALNPMSRDERAARRGGSKTQISPLKAHPCGLGSHRIPVSLLPLHDIHDSHNSARGSPSSVVFP
ncbi:unnamed protein product [Prunus armeniaca]